jgi:hypothetical protein
MGNEMWMAIESIKTLFFSFASQASDIRTLLFYANTIIHYMPSFLCYYLYLATQSLSCCYVLFSRQVQQPLHYVRPATLSNFQE